MSEVRDSRDTRTAPGREGGERPPGLIIAVLALCGTLVSLQQTLVLPLLPDFPEILDTSAENASWLVTITLLTAAVGTPIVSRLADMFGKRLMLVSCMVAVIVGSVVSAMSASLGTVVAGRALSGLGACLVPVGISIMRDHLPADSVGTGVALMSATLGIGGAIGMPLAGVIYESLDWHALFLVSGGFAVVMLVAVLAVVPESTVKTRGRFDAVGALLLSVALTCFLLAVTKAGSWGWTSAPTLACLLVAALVLAAWVPWELRVGQPLVDIRTSLRRTVLLTNASSVLVGFAMFTNFLTSTQQVQMPAATGYGFGLSVVETGLAMLPAGILMVLASPVASRLIRRFGPRALLIAGALLIAVGFVLRSLLHGSVVEVMVGSGVASLGTALAFAAMPTLIMRSVPITETASANGLNTLLRSIGTSTASAGVALIMSLYVVSVGDEQVPSFDAYQLVFALGTGAALGGALIAAFIPRPARVEDAENAEAAAPEAARARMDGVKPGGVAREVLLRGSITRPDGRPLRHAVATVMHPDGRHIDWGRTDDQGRFTLATPGPGHYLVIASAEGWAPTSWVGDLDPLEPLSIQLRERLLLTGRVLAGEHLVPGATVTVIKHSGEYVATTRTDDAGRFQLGLPPAGRYIVTTVGPLTERTTSEVVTVADSSTGVELDLGPLPPGALTAAGRQAPQ